LVGAESEVIISSPGLDQDKVARIIKIMKSRQEAGVKINIITERPEDRHFGDIIINQFLSQQLMDNGMVVTYFQDEAEHFAVIDKTIVWHGGMNLLGKEDIYDNLIRIKDVKVAEELLAMAFSK